MTGWVNFSPWWSLLPIGVLFLWGLLKANHELFLEAEREHAATEIELTRKLQMAQAMGPDRVESLARQREEERTARLKRMVIAAFDAAAHAHQTSDGADRTRAAIRDLRIERETLGPGKVSSVYESIRQLEERLDSQIGVRHLGPNADPLREARAMKDTILRELDALL